MQIKALSFAVAVAMAASVSAGPVFAQGSGEVVVTAPPRAAPGVEVKHEAVKFGDLDIDRYVGAETLIGRLHGAAVRVCQPATHHRSGFKDVEDYRGCIDGAMKRAVAEIDHPMVRQVFERTGD